MLKRTDKNYPENISVLTSLRFWAAFGVAFHHCCMIIIENATPELATQIPVISKLYLGVDFFFILSGFILTHVYLDKLETGKILPQNFYIKRFARIYPAYIFAFTLTLIQKVGFSAAGITEPLNPPLTITSLLLYIFCLQAWWDFTTLIRINGPSWSISAEWFAYLSFPLLLILFKRLSLASGAGLVALTLTICWLTAAYVIGQPLTRLDFDYGILRIIPEFIAGIWLYLFGRKYELRLYDIKAFSVLIITLMALLGFLANDFWIVLCLAAIIFIGAEQARQEYQWKLSSEETAYLGEISYSIYLLHIPLLEITLSLMNLGTFSDETKVGMLFAALFAVIPTAMLTYTFIETPMRRYINKKPNAPTQKIH